MTTNAYHFVDRWRVTATCEEVYDILWDAASYPAWWGSTYRAITEVTPAGPDGLGGVTHVRAAGWLPYTIQFDSTITAINRPHGFTLEAHGARFTRQFDYGPMLESNKTVELEPEEVMIEGVASTIALRVLKVDPVESQLRVRLTVTTPRANQEPLVTRTEFSVGFYDLPMIDNTRLATGQRCAVTLTNFSRKDRTADLSVVCFPGEYASLKDRPYYDEVVRQLQRAGQAQ